MQPPPELSAASDERLVELALSGFQRAYGELMRRHEPAVLRRIEELVRDYDVARDLVQQTFVNAFDSLAQHDPKRSLAGWLARIAFTTTADYFRKQQRDKKKRRDTVAFGDAFDSAPTRIARAPAAPVTGRIAAREVKFVAKVSALENAIRALPRDQRRCIRLRFFQQRTFQDIARILDLPMGTVKSHVSRGLDTLQAKLNPMADWLLYDTSSSDTYYTPA